MAQKFVETNLYFERGVAVVLVDLEIGFLDEGDWFVFAFGTEDVP